MHVVARALRLILVLAAIALAAGPSRIAAQGNVAVDPDTLDRTVAYNRRLTDIITGYMDATSSDSLTDAIVGLIDPPDRDAAIAAARQTLAAYTETIEAVDAAYSALPDPPADYLPNARNNLEKTLAFIDFLAAGAQETRRTLYRQIAAVMRGDVLDAAVLARGEVEQIIMELGAENAFIRFQLAALSADNPSRGLFEATILGNEAVRSYLSLINRFERHSVADKQRLFGEIVLWLAQLESVFEASDTRIAAMCAGLARFRDEPVRGLANGFCELMTQAKDIERDILKILAVYRDYAKAAVTGEVTAELKATIDGAERDIAAKVNARVATQLKIAQQSAALNRALRQ